MRSIQIVISVDYEINTDLDSFNKRIYPSTFLGPEVYSFSTIRGEVNSINAQYAIID